LVRNEGLTIKGMHVEIPNSRHTTATMISHTICSQSVSQSVSRLISRCEESCLVLFIYLTLARLFSDNLLNKQT
jgi:hypothetical protein